MGHRGEDSFRQCPEFKYNNDRKRELPLCFKACGFEQGDVLLYTVLYRVGLH